MYAHIHLEKEDKYKPRTEVVACRSTCGTIIHLPLLLSVSPGRVHSSLMSLIMVLHACASMAAVYILDTSSYIYIAELN